MRNFLFLCLAIMPIGVSAQSLEHVGELRYRRLIDPITDADRSLVYTAEVNAREVRTGQTIDRIGRLIWRCHGAQIEVILRADGLPIDSALVRWRVDDHTASEFETWRTGASGVSVFAPRGSAEQLTTLARAGHGLVARVKYDVGGDFDYEFQLDGAEDAIGRLACDPVAATVAAPHGNPHFDEGTTYAVRGWYKRNRHIEERWVLQRKNLPLPEPRLSF